MPDAKQKSKSKAQQSYRHAMMWLRRIHLYSGLFMLPWVLLYGFTGWFFNHPRYFTGDEHRVIAPAAVADGALTELPTADEVAALAVDEINLASFLVDGPEVELSPDLQPTYSGYLAFNANGEKQTHVIVLHPATGAGEVRTTHVPAEVSGASDGQSGQAAPLVDIGSIDNVSNPQSVAADVLPEVLEDLGLEGAQAFPRRGGVSLSFNALVDGEPTRVTYSLGSGAISSRLISAPPREMPVKSFLQRLHMARGYVPNFGTRTWWAITVDAMFVSMVFWGLSGVLMWWQIRRTRLLGSLVLAASLVSATLLAIGMHDHLSSGRRGRGGGGGNHGGPAMTSRSTRPASPTAFDSGLSAPKNPSNSQTNPGNPTE